MPPRPTARPGAERSGRTGVMPARFIRATSLAGPTASRTMIAGTLSDCGQRLADRDGAAMEAVEIGRRIGAEAGRPVLDQALGVASPSSKARP